MNRPASFAGQLFPRKTPRADSPQQWGALARACQDNRAELAAAIFARPVAKRGWMVGLLASGLVGIGIASVTLWNPEFKPPAPRPPLKIKARLVTPPPVETKVDPPPKIETAKDPSSDEADSQNKPKPRALAKTRARPARERAKRKTETSPSKPREAGPVPSEPGFRGVDFSQEPAGVLNTGSMNTGRGAGGAVGAGGSGDGVGSGASGRGGIATVNKARPPRVRGDKNWSCRWPSSALSLSSHRESAVVKLRIDARGQVVQAKVLQDPGFGFGAEAVHCAKKQRFHPARDSQGKRTGPASLTVRVRFRRNERQH